MGHRIVGVTYCDSDEGSGIVWLELDDGTRIGATLDVRTLCTMDADDALWLALDHIAQAMAHAQWLTSRQSHRSGEVGRRAADAVSSAVRGVGPVGRDEASIRWDAWHQARVETMRRRLS